MMELIGELQIIIAIQQQQQIQQTLVKKSF
jgi:hypothetical protein